MCRLVEMGVGEDGDRNKAEAGVFECEHSSNRAEVGTKLTGLDFFATDSQVCKNLKVVGAAVPGGGSEPVLYLINDNRHPRDWQERTPQYTISTWVNNRSGV